MSKTLHIPNFLGGLRDGLPPQQIADNEVSSLLNFMLTRPFGVFDPTDTETWKQLKTRPVARRYSDDIAVPTLDLVELNLFSSGAITYIISGGIDGTPNLRFYYTQVDGGIPRTNTLLYSVASNTESSVWSVNHMQYVYTGDGYTDNRKWDGSVLTNLGAAHPRCLTAATHKSRLLLANDITNNAPNRLWISNVGSDTIPSTSFIDIGTTSEGIVQIVDAIDKIIVIKERSTWYVYLSANLSDSQVIVVDKDRGAQKRKAVVPYGDGFICVARDRGLEIFSNGYVPLPGALEEYKKLGESASIYVYNDCVYIIANNYMHIYSIKYHTNTRHSFEAYLPNTVIYNPYWNNLTGATKNTNPLLVSLFDNGFGPQGAILESNITQSFVTKKFTFGDLARYKAINYVVFACEGITTPPSFSARAYCDGVLKQTVGFTPNSNSYVKCNFIPSLVRGREIQFEIEGFSAAADEPSIAFREAWIDYNIENAVI